MVECSNHWPTMCLRPHGPFRLAALAVMGVFVACGANPCFADVPAAAPQTRPAATQPATDTSDTPDFDDLWNTPDAPSVLTTAADVRALTPARAAAALPVRLHGTVTYIG